MLKSFLTLSCIVLFCSVLLNCETDKNAIFDAALDRLEPELEATELVEDKIALLEKFRMNYRGHPKIETVAKRIQSLKSSQEKAKVKEEKMKFDPNDLKDKIEEGELEAMAVFALSAIAKGTKPGSDSIEKVTLPGFNRVHEFENTAKVLSPFAVRLLVLGSMIRTDSKWIQRCNAACQNVYASKVLKKALGTDLFNLDGSMNKEGVDKLLGLLGKDTFAMINYSDLGKVYGPSIRHILDVRAAIRKMGDQKTMEAFRVQKAAELGALPDWYRKMSENSEALKAISLKNVRATQTLGFWIRRMDDKTAPSIEAFLRRAIEKEKSPNP